LDVFRHRKGLHRTFRRASEGAVTLGFIGGSITVDNGSFHWPEPVISWFLERFPGIRVTVENAALGATGSERAVLVAQANLVDRGCDLVFVDYAVNDYYEPSDKRMRTREGLVRKLIAGAGRDIVFAYTFSQEMYADMSEGQIPATIQEFEQLAEHYGIGSVWMGLYAWEEVGKGRMRWEEWLPDGLHPTSRGSLSYAQSVIAFLEREQRRTSLSMSAAVMPEPLHPGHWGDAEHLPLSRVKLDGPWRIRRYPALDGSGLMIDTAAVGARLSFSFEGRGLTLGFDFGKASSEIRYRLDGADWVVTERTRPLWAGEAGWLRMSLIADDLPRGEHHFEMEVIHGNKEGCTGTNCRLALIGVIK